ncbi:hypothetical protein Tco_0767354 [Tanacetum coccineum]
MKILPVSTSNNTAVGSNTLSWKSCQGSSSKLNLPDHRYQDYEDIYCQGRLLSSFQDDEHVGQDARSQGGKRSQGERFKDLEIKDKVNRQ